MFAADDKRFTAAAHDGQFALEFFSADTHCEPRQTCAALFFLGVELDWE